MGNGCAAAARGHWSNALTLFGTRRLAFAHAKNGWLKGSEERLPVTEGCPIPPAGEHRQLLASEHLRQNGAAAWGQTLCWPATSTVSARLSLAYSLPRFLKPTCLDLSLVAGDPALLS